MGRLFDTRLEKIMSHFCVLVVGKDAEKQLAPYEEFECSGTESEFVKTIDKTDYFIKLYNEEESYLMARNLSTGALEEIYNERGAVLPQFIGEDRHMICPEGYTFVKVKYCEVPKYADFATFMSHMDSTRILHPGEEPDLKRNHKFGFIQVDENGNARSFKRTNPNAKWDWYTEGGRWDNFFLLKKEVQKAYKAERSSIAFKRDIDIDGMIDIAKTSALKEWDKVRLALNGERWIPLETLMNEPGTALQTAARTYWKQPAVQLVRDTLGTFISADTIDTFLLDREAYEKRYTEAPFITYALLKDGVWTDS